MMTKTYNKLVRDNIPAIIEAKGAACETEILSDADYLRLLDAKLDEELAEYHQDQNLEELADLMEVIYACAKARGYTVAELEALRAEKAAKRGGFDRKILLKTVTEE
jgi:predicted house-cleaning noncanonical NTP pyrophosphatase (MazG superfamily)